VECVWVIVDVLTVFKTEEAFCDEMAFQSNGTTYFFAAIAPVHVLVFWTLYFLIFGDGSWKLLISQVGCANALFHSALTRVRR
jgi:hypothetical protein